MAGERLNADDALALYRTGDILAVGWMANHVRERMHGDKTYFNVNRHLNPTNVCVAACRLCAFGRKKDTPGAYTMALEEAFETAASGYTEAVTEFHIVGGLHPDLPFQYFLDLVSGLKQRFPQVHLKAFTMVEVAYLAKRAKLSIQETLEQLKAAGVDSLPGGGAEIFADRVRHIICDHKIDGDQWLDTREACSSDRPEVERHHALRPRRKRRRPRRSPAEAACAAGRNRRLPDVYSAGLPSRQHAACSICPRPPACSTSSRSPSAGWCSITFPHIKAYWQMMTPKIAQISLRFGADDIDGTVIEEKIYHDAGATTPQGMRRQDLVRLIREAGREPIERDTLYRPVTRTETSVTVAV